MLVGSAGVASVRDGDAEDALAGSGRAQLGRAGRGADRVHPAVSRAAPQGPARPQVLLRLRLLPRADRLQETNLRVHAGKATTSAFMLRRVKH